MQGQKGGGRAKARNRLLSVCICDLSVLCYLSVLYKYVHVCEAVLTKLSCLTSPLIK